MTLDFNVYISSLLSDGSILVKMRATFTWMRTSNLSNVFVETNFTTEKSWLDSIVKSKIISIKEFKNGFFSSGLMVSKLSKLLQLTTIVCSVMINIFCRHYCIWTLIYTIAIENFLCTYSKEHIFYATLSNFMNF